MPKTRSEGEDGIYVPLKMTHAGKSRFAGSKRQSFPSKSYGKALLGLVYCSVSPSDEATTFYASPCAAPELQPLGSFCPVPLYASLCPTLTLGISQKPQSLAGTFTFYFCLREMLDMMFEAFLELRCSRK